jgi:hypothetical protein
MYKKDCLAVTVSAVVDVVAEKFGVVWLLVHSDATFGVCTRGHCAGGVADEGN